MCVWEPSQARVVHVQVTDLFSLPTVNRLGRPLPSEASLLSSALRVLLCCVAFIVVWGIKAWASFM